MYTLLKYEKKLKIDIFDTVVLRSESKQITILSYESHIKMSVTAKWY